MYVRLLRPFVAICLVIAAGCLPMSDESEAGPGNEDDPHCPGSCPGEMVPVDRCPTFPTKCEEVADCDGTMICSPPAYVDPDQQNNSSPDIDCDEPVFCPPGTEEVSSCPDDELCSHINLCDERLICREDPALCAEVPLCPDGERAVDGCVHEDCYQRHHCSGPVDCLPCTEDLEEGCPEGTIPIYEGYCDEVEIYENSGPDILGAGRNDDDNDDDDDDDDERKEREFEEEDDEAPVVCKRVETCKETLFCSSSSVCLEDAACAKRMEKVDDCDQAKRDCYTIPACSGPIACEAEKYDEGCVGEPKCPNYYEEAEIEDCVDDYRECVMKVKCGQVLGCLPAGE